jgi:protein disulfide-isomerase A1
MEAQENDLPSSAPFRVAGFPTLKFKPAGGKEFLDYDGDRSLESLIAFVEQNSKNDLTPVPEQDNSSQTTFEEPRSAEEVPHDEL